MAAAGSVVLAAAAATVAAAVAVAASFAGAAAAAAVAGFVAVAAAAAVGVLPQRPLRCWRLGLTKPGVLASSLHPFHCLCGLAFWRLTLNQGRAANAFLQANGLREPSTCL